MSDSSISLDVRCANCGQQLDAHDKFCRECGLPTMRHAAERKQVQVEPPDTAELQRALNVVPDPRPFVRAEPEPEALDEAGPTPPPQNTRELLRATSPTQTMRMAGSTLVMIGLIAVLVVAGVALLAMALQG